MKSLKVKAEGGYLIATAAPDPEFPGIDVEFVEDDANVEGTRPRVLFEDRAMAQCER